jgi:hypothetical protein
MARDDEQSSNEDTNQPESVELREEIAGETPPDNALETIESANLDTEGDAQPSLMDELAALREEEASAQADESAEGETASAAAVFGESDPPISPSSAAGSTTDQAGTAADSAANAPAPPLSFLGPIRRLDDLPQHDIQQLDQESAGKLLAAIRNPEQFEPGYLEHTTIRNLFSTQPSNPDDPGDAEKPWYDSALPPVRLEVTLLHYDRMVDKAIDRSAGYIDHVTDQKIDGKINSAKFELRGEIRRLLR